MLENPARHKEQQLERHGFRYQPRLWASLTHLWLLGLAYALSFMLYVGAGFAALLGEVPVRRLVMDRARPRARERGV